MKLSTKYFILAALLALTVPATYAQSMDFAQLTVPEDMTPEERLAKKIELTTDALEKANERVLEMVTKLEVIELEKDTVELELRDKLIERAKGYNAFYDTKLEALLVAQTIEEVDVIINDIIAYREGEYASGAKEILEFILVYSYTPSVLALADQRLQSILQDVARLEGLELIEPNAFVPRIDEAKTILQKAHDLRVQAATLIMDNYAASLLVLPNQEIETQATTTPVIVSTPEITPKLLAEQSLNEIKALYQIFIETGQEVGETLGIN